MGAHYRLLWADDEIDLLKSHILYLQQRGYEVVPVLSGEDALHLIAEEPFDLVLLDERMPGLDGLTVLERLKTLRPELPVVMVTKQEDEELMEAALGRATADFLTKPVNPSQVLSVCKRILESRRLREEVVSRDYVQEFGRLSTRLSGPPLSPSEWGDLAEALAWWSIQLDETGQEGLAESLGSLQQEADGVLARQVVERYPEWISGGRSWQERLRESLSRSLEADPTDGDLPPLPVPQPESPLFVTDVLARAVFPILARRDRAVLVILDCLRFDQWLALEPLISGHGRVERMPLFSLVPTATPFARNALLSGRFPDEVAAEFPDLWEGSWDSDDRSLNRYEPELLTSALQACGSLLPGARVAAFERVTAPGDAEAVTRRLGEGIGAGLSVVVVNFLDLLAHGQAESEILQELAPDPAAFRALASQWFDRSPLSALLGELMEQDIPVVLASDHGSVQVRRGVEVKADRTASRGLRFKLGRNLNADPRWTHRIDDLSSWRLPPYGLTTTCMLAREDAFLVFPADAAPRRRKFTGSFQHGGVSVMELIVPLVRMTSR
jgi:CheY-like chemotaxis protein